MYSIAFSNRWNLPNKRLKISWIAHFTFDRLTKPAEIFGMNNNFSIISFILIHCLSVAANFSIHVFVEFVCRVLKKKIVDFILHIVWHREYFVECFDLELLVLLLKVWQIGRLYFRNCNILWLFYCVYFKQIVNKNQLTNISKYARVRNYLRFIFDFHFFVFLWFDLFEPLLLSKVTRCHKQWNESDNFHNWSDLFLDCFAVDLSFIQNGLE